MGACLSGSTFIQELTVESVYIDEGSLKSGLIKIVPLYFLSNKNEFS